MKKRIKLIVNKRHFVLNVDPNRRLLDILRDDLGLTGTKEGCGGGDCGACTVIMNGKAVPSCLVLGVEADGSDVLTIEGVSDGEKLHPLQEEFLIQGAIQCGFCTPGMILSAKAFLASNPRPSEEEVRKAMAGNLCRCSGYAKIVKSIMSAAGKLAGNRRSED
jgi:carbon-monoxide dehydrogenase small subunit